ncbi:unnamed protein product [Dovyalis caffra]|uniref:Exonuclease domain-containing protein n=1 Tax=Dovyalis caffra TaxID=77055 RepID=A0AAV1RDS6_9ROSI|nr:unnamed protein product [Dovyalis caffra]
MNFLSNAFSLLEIDADDDRLKSAPSSSASSKPKSASTTNNTGLNTEVDRILEIACIITDGNLTKSVEKEVEECTSFVEILTSFQPSRSLDGMRIILGLTKKVLQSKLSEREAEKQVVEFVKRHVGTYPPLLAGNSKYMPDLASLFSHVVVDVSSVKALCMRWYPRDQKKAPQKENKHRALDDIRESITELKYYKANIFKPISKK